MKPPVARVHLANCGERCKYGAAACPVRPVGATPLERWAAALREWRRRLEAKP